VGRTDNDVRPCPGCGLVAPALDGPTDPYAGASPACWATFQRVTVRDYGEFRYPEAHRLIVDAYMSQHPGYATPAGRRSVAVHLVGLCLVLERGAGGKTVGTVMARVFPDKHDIAPLEPIPPLGELTVASLLDAPDLTAHSRLARTWAEAVWRAWTPFHSRVRAWAALAETAAHRPQSRGRRS
jgi:hypothetical protein